MNLSKNKSPRKYKQYKTKNSKSAQKQKALKSQPLLLNETPKKSREHRLSIDSMSQGGQISLQKFNSAPAKINNSANSAFTPYAPSDKLVGISKKLLFGDNIKLDYCL